ncbi:uncharacterized protein LOC133734191 isoform X3 [Rosa rugosa]|uniref:uncharacterized protein LOC133734191 isoform X3 n=1 Tax=Rosa rugosa TaxID=74645 RepID=UPI002B413DB6|nr:uncharacterized protein LOC133734191 isoform X3 [Rosa rugosa]XP_062017814.1 uncharacterized protein LOC133734191 isoform X3 [Rosa rugosa]
MSQLSSLSFRPYYGSLSFSVNRTPSFCRFNLPFRCPTTSGLRGNSLTGALSPDMCQLTGLWYLFQVKKKQFFFRNFITIVMFGAIGTLVSCTIIAFGT